MGILSLRRVGRSLLVPALAAFSALAIGAVLMWIFGDDPVVAYRGLFTGAFGSGRAWATTARKMTPLILTGLSVAIAFKAGLLNIGASGQFVMGSVFAVAAGINFEGLPAVAHLPLAILVGAIGGTIWGMIPGILKVYTGAHEVITTIMLNYVAANFAGWTVYAGGTQGQQPGPLWDRTAGAISETPDVLISARIPWIFPEPYRVHWGIVLVIGVAIFIWWLIFRTTVGFELRTIGRNASAARYAGINAGRMIVVSMAIAGGLAGLAGAVETLGINHKFAPEFGGAVGFDGITVALLGHTNPLGIVLAAFLFGAMDAGAPRMQFDSYVSQDIIQVIQALVLAFVAAPAIIRAVYRVRQRAGEIEDTQLSSSWGS